MPVYFGNTLTEETTDGVEYYRIRFGGDGTSNDAALICATTNTIPVRKDEYDALAIGACDSGLKRWKLKPKKKTATKQPGAQNGPRGKTARGPGTKQKSARRPTAKKKSKPPLKKKGHVTRLMRRRPG